MSTATNLEVDTTLIRDEFASAVLAGLAREQKSIPCRFLYDARGSELFEDITRLDEYYPTRTELELLETHGPEIHALAGAGAAIIEFGSGSSRKTQTLIDHLDDIVAYVPIDISDDALAEAAERLRSRYPGLAVLPVHGDFSRDIELPEAVREVPKLGFFPGSTIGNLTHAGASGFLADAAGLLGADGSLLIGVDLKKSLDVLLPAYDDAEGVTAEFNLNLLHRINRELDGDIDVSQFAHEAIYSEDDGRVEIYIVSLADQEINVLGRSYEFTEGERLHTENSHKYSIAEFADMARNAGWRPDAVWTDANELFSLHFLRRT